MNDYLDIENIDKEVIELLSKPLTVDLMELDTDFDKTEVLCEKFSIMLNQSSFNSKDFIKKLYNNERAINIFLKISLLWIVQQSWNSENNFNESLESLLSLCNAISKQKEFINLYDDYMLFVPEIDECRCFKNIFKKARYFGCTPEQIIVLYMDEKNEIIKSKFSDIIFKFLNAYENKDLQIIFARLKDTSTWDFNSN